MTLLSLHSYGPLTARQPEHLYSLTVALTATKSSPMRKVHTGHVKASVFHSWTIIQCSLMATSNKQTDSTNHDIKAGILFQIAHQCCPAAACDPISTTADTKPKDWSALLLGYPVRPIGKGLLTV